MFDKIKGRPWDMQPSERELLDRPLPISVPEVPVPEVNEPETRPYKARRVYLTLEVLERYGVSVGCPGCEAKLAGGPAKGHSEACRSRIAKAMKEDEL